MTLTFPSDREIVITREFNAPRDLVFKAHTSCEHLARWLGPRYLTMVFCEMDFRPGGKYRYVHRAPDGSEYGFRGEIREVVPPEKIVQTFEFEAMPGRFSVDTLTFEEHDGRTKLTARSLFQSKEDRDGMVQSGMEAGVRESYERLDELLAEVG
ncbi:MAG: SRPBCC family protein [bacterium]